MFLSKKDYKPQIQKEIQDIISDDPNAWHQSELQAEEEITGYLRNRFTTPDIFNKVGTDRNHRIVMIMVDVVLYHIHSRIAPRNIPEVRIIRYEQAIDWLKAVNRGSIVPDLPILKDEDGEDAGGGFRTGSNEKQNHHW